HTNMASKLDFNSSAVMSFPTWVLVTNFTPSLRITSTRLSTTHFSSLKSGIPYRSNPPMLLFFSYTVTWCPALFNWAAAAKPAGPEPIIATFFPVLVCGGLGFMYPSSKAFSAIDFSMYSIATGGLLIPKTQELSQGAGQILPVNSGKLLV